MKPLFVRWLLHRRDLKELTARVREIEEQYERERPEVLRIRRAFLQEASLEEDEGRAREFRMTADSDLEIFTLNEARDREEALYDLYTAVTSYYRVESRRLMIPMPSNEIEDEYWISSYGITCLNLSGIAKVRSEIRKEYKERFEIYQTRIAMALGLIGAVTGTLSLFWRH